MNKAIYLVYLDRNILISFCLLQVLLAYKFQVPSTYSLGPDTYRHIDGQTT